METIANVRRLCIVESRSNLSVERDPGLARIAIRKVVQEGTSLRPSQAFGHPLCVISGPRTCDVMGTVTIQRVRATPLMMAVRQNEHPPIVQTILLGGGEPNLGKKPENRTCSGFCCSTGQTRRRQKKRRLTPLHVIA